MAWGAVFTDRGLIDDAGSTFLTCSEIAAEARRACRNGSSPLFPLRAGPEMSVFLSRARALLDANDILTGEFSEIFQGAALKDYADVSGNTGQVDLEIFFRTGCVPG